MATKDDKSGETVVPTRGGGRAGDLRAPTKAPRRFPWRLLLWALLMTATTGAAGYYAWQFYQVADQRQDELSKCATELAPAQAQVTTAQQALTTCQGQVSTLETKQQDIDAQLAKMSKDLNATGAELDQLRVQKADFEKRIAAIEKIREQFAKMIDTGELSVVSRRGSLVVELPSEVLFPSASADLSRKGEVAVLQVGGILKQFDDRRFLVVGHTDNQPLKSADYKDNWALSVARALTVTRYLVEGGMKPANLMAAGAGDHEPIADNKSGEGRARNRRIEIVLLPALSELPPLPASLSDGGAKPDDKKPDDKKPDDKKPD